MIKKAIFCAEGGLGEIKVGYDYPFRATIGLIRVGLLYTSTPVSPLGHF